jgi:hypothetical protein
VSQKIGKLAKLAASALGPLRHRCSRAVGACRQEMSGERIRQDSLKRTVYAGPRGERARRRARLRHAVMLARHADRRPS